MTTINKRRIKNIVRNAINNAIKAEALTPEQISTFRNGIFRKWYLEDRWATSDSTNKFFYSDELKQLRESDTAFDNIMREYFKAQKALIEAESNIDEYLANAAGEQMY